MLGELSAKYESGGDAGSISSGWGDAGGKSYGCYQFASNMGIPQAFVEWLQSIGSTYGDSLANAGQPGTQDFDDMWTYISQNDQQGFVQLQHDYVKAVYYDQAVENLSNIGFNVLNRTEAVQQVLWSRAVQYSAHWMPELFQNAANLAGQDLGSINDHNLIYYIYEVNLTDMSWTSGSPTLRPGLFDRFRNERQDALNMLGW